MATRKTRRKKSRGTRSQNTPGNFWLFIVTRTICGLVFSSLVLLAALDFEIRSRFAGNIQSQPAHIYARPMGIVHNEVIDPAPLRRTLVEQGYVPTSEISQPGEFAAAAGVFDIYLQGFNAGDVKQPSQAVRIRFDGQQVTGIVDHASGAELDRVYIEPGLIGSLQLGPYKDRITLKLHQVPELLIESLLAMEDRNFAQHIGIDLRAIARALWSNVKAGKPVQGGSTLSQQLVKNLFLSPTRTLSRKLTEALMAVTMELRFSKAQILELYLNEIFLGQSGNRAVHGFALASDFYFGRPLQQLNLHEIALLVGLIPAPSYYNPRRHPERALKRRNLVLKTLARTGGISKYTAETLGQKPLGIVPYEDNSNSDFPSYLDYLHRQLRQYYSEDVLRTNGLRLYTTMDSHVQSVTQSGLTRTLQKLERSKGFADGTLQGAAIIVDPRSGEILAMVGDRIQGYSGFNRALDAHRPIGSLVKPVVYLTALEQPRKYSLATVLQDEPLTLTSRSGETWSPQNYDQTFRGPVPLYQGLIKSYNLPTVRLGLDLGMDNIVATMRRLGVERDIKTYPSVLLGASQHSPLEMAQMYQPLANQGVKIPLRSLRSIDNYRGKTVARFPLTEQRVIDQDSAALIDHALKLVVNQGTASWLNSQFDPGLFLAGKTGTTDGYRDSWFAGYSENLLAVVWVGRDNNKPINLSGASGAMRVWAEIMSQLTLSSAGPSTNQNLVEVAVDPESGLVANHNCLSRQPLLFIKGYQPKSFAPCSGLAAKFKSWFNIKSGTVEDAIEVEEIGVNRP